MRIQYLLIIISLGFSLFTIGCNSEQESVELKLISSPNYPRWLSADDYRTHQTSGITFINEENSKKEFLVVDDIGLIHRLFIMDDTVFTFEPIKFSKKAEEFFKGYPKLDFEEICYDKFSNSVFISIEGNEENFVDYTGIIKLQFKNDDVHKNEIENIVKLKITPEKQFLKYVDWNIGYEGLTVDSNFMYLGLEGFKNESGFVDSSLILVVDNVNYSIIKIISTRAYNIHTIGAMFHDSENYLWLIDRNNRNLFRLRFDSDLNITQFNNWNLIPSIPGYRQFSYICSFEGITIDSDFNIYIVDDPWMKQFIPADSILAQLNEQTKINFKNFVPVIYKYVLTK